MHCPHCNGWVMKCTEPDQFYGDKYQCFMCGRFFTFNGKALRGWGRTVGIVKYPLKQKKGIGFFSGDFEHSYNGEIIK